MEDRLTAPLLKKLDDAIKLEKNIETERMSYMTYEMKIREFEQAGYHHGIQDGRREGIREGRREGIREGQLESIKTLMKNTKWSAEKAMDSIGIAKSMQKEYLAMLQTT